jgi:hypothetical protein
VQVPGEAPVCPRRLGDPLDVLADSNRDVERSSDLHPIRGREGEDLLLTQGEPRGGGVVGHVAARRLAVQPLPHVPLAHTRLGGELLGRRRHHCLQRRVQAQAVAQHGVVGVEARPQVGDEPPQQFVQLALVHGHSGPPGPRVYITLGRRERQRAGMRRGCTGDNAKRWMPFDRTVVSATRRGHGHSSAVCRPSRTPAVLCQALACLQSDGDRAGRSGRVGPWWASAVPASPSSLRPVRGVRRVRRGPWRGQRPAPRR